MYVFIAISRYGIGKKVLVVRKDGCVNDRNEKSDAVFFSPPSRKDTITCLIIRGTKSRTFLKNPTFEELIRLD